MDTAARLQATRSTLSLLKGSCLGDRAVSEAPCSLLFSIISPVTARKYQASIPSVPLKRAITARGLTFHCISALINVWEMNFDSHPQQNKLERIKCRASFQVCCFYLLAIIFSHK